jgi:hypothetical protein
MGSGSLASGPWGCRWPRSSKYRDTVLPLAFCPTVAGLCPEALDTEALDVEQLDVEQLDVEQLDAATSGSTIGNGLFIVS